jgi:hypothetical protein
MRDGLSVAVVGAACEDSNSALSWCIWQKPFSCLLFLQTVPVAVRARHRRDIQDSYLREQILALEDTKVHKRDARTFGVIVKPVGTL